MGKFMRREWVTGRKKWKGRMLLALILFGLLFQKVPPVQAAAVTPSQKKIVSTTDYFVSSLLFNTYANFAFRDRELPDKKGYLKAMKKFYKGELDTKAKSAIAAGYASCTKSAEASYEPKAGCPDIVEVYDASDVKSVYRDLFGSCTRLNLPKISDYRKKSSYRMGIAQNLSGSKVYFYGVMAECAHDMKVKSVKKAGRGKYVVTERAAFYRHWGDQQMGNGPLYTVTVKITIKKKLNAAYGYLITGLKIS